MTIRYLETATVYYPDTGASQQYPSLEAAIEAAEAYVGNSSYAKPFPDLSTRLYGPGDGTTSVMVRLDVEFGDEP